MPWYSAARARLFVAAAALLSAALAGCLGTVRSSTAASGETAAQGTPPGLLLGAFEDDYGHRFQVTADAWTQQPGGSLSIVEWFEDERSILARTRPDDSTEPVLWTRIDWVEFDDMDPWTWGFCLVVWDAPTREAALAAPAADADQPRNGCNGFPFSRMRSS